MYPMWTLQGQYQPLAHWEVAGVCGKGRQGAPPGESWRGLQQHWCVYSYHQSSLMQPRHGTAPSWCCWWLQLLFVCPLCGESLPDQVCHPPLSQVQVQPLAWLQHLLVFATVCRCAVALRPALSCAAAPGGYLGCAWQCLASLTPLHGNSAVWELAEALPVCMRPPACIGGGWFGFVRKH